MCHHEEPIPARWRHNADGTITLPYEAIRRQAEKAFELERHARATLSPSTRDAIAHDRVFPTGSYVNVTGFMVTP